MAAVSVSSGSAGARSITRRPIRPQAPLTPREIVTADLRLSGDTAGEGVDGFGAEWYVIAPNGKKIEAD